MSSRYRRSDRWNLVFEGGLLVLNAGADNIYAIEDVAPDVAREVLTMYADRDIDPATLSAPASAIFEQLVTAGIVELHTAQPIRTVSVRFIGYRDERFVQRLAGSLGEHHIHIVDQKPCQLNVFVRTNGRLRDLVDGDYPRITTPHLLLDLAYHHTFSLGPLVFPGDTACLACLVGRLSTYWGDAVPPGKPAMTEQVDLVVALATLEIEKIIAADQTLINQTVSYDFGNREIKKHRLYKLPWCPVCGHAGEAPTAGSFSLPWVKQR